LAKYLAEAGAASRRKAEELIFQGRVRVNGQTVTELGAKLNPEEDSVELDGRLLKRDEHVYILLYKPAGYISSVYDPQGRPTVIDLLNGVKKRVYPVGRLDYDTEGLLLLSNDGEFTNLMTHPRYRMRKKYEALVKGFLKERDMNTLRAGVMLEDGLTAPAQVRVIKTGPHDTLLEIQIHEGRKRQVRRMCASVGHPVITLKRTTLEFLSLKGLKPGQYRFLTQDEIKKLVLIAKSSRRKVLDHN
jgi:pseudouridine synthase